MKAMTFDKSFAEKKDTFANLIANLSRMVLTTSERLFYIKLLTRGFRSTPIYIYIPWYTMVYHGSMYVMKLSVLETSQTSSLVLCTLYY